MNAKRAFVLAIAFVILALLYYVIERPAQNTKKEPVPVIPDFSTERATDVLLVSPEKGRIRLQKTKTGWKLLSDNQTYAADPAPVDKLLKTVADLKADTVVSKNPKNFPAFETTSEKGIDVTVRDDARNILARFFVGKSGPDIFSTYLRIADSNRVILSGGILKNVFEKELKDWRDKTIFSLNTNTFQDYVVTGDKTLHLTRTGADEWQVQAPESFTPDPAKVEGMLKSFAQLKAVDFPEGALSEFQLEAPLRTITVTQRDGSSKSLFLGKEKNSYQHFVKTSDNDTVYLIENHILEKLCPDTSDLKPAETAEGLPADNATAR